MKKISLLRLHCIALTTVLHDRLAKLAVKIHSWIALIGFVGFALDGSIAYSATVAPITKIIVASGDSPSRGTGEFSELKVPVLNNNGEAAFAGTLRDEGFLVGGGVFRGNSNSRIAYTIVLEMDPTPDVNGNVGAINNPSLYINNRDQVSLSVTLTDTLGGGLDSSAIYRGDGSTSGLTQMARASQSVPEGQGRFEPFLSPAISMNNAGQVAFSAHLRSTPGRQADNQGIYRSDGTNITKIVRSGDPAPSTEGAFLGLLSVLSGPAINETGQVLFIGQVQSDSNQRFVSGIFRGDGNTIVKIATQGDTTPGGNGKLGSLLLTRPAFNDKGETAFATLLAETDLGLADSFAIFRGDENKLVQVVRRGDLTPGNNGRFLEFGADVAINNDGKVLFVASITGATGGAAGGIFIGDGESITTVARLNDPAPGGGRFRDFSTAMNALNNSGQVVFYASIEMENGGSPGGSFGLFIYDPVLGIQKVVRKDDPLAGLGQITHIEFEGGLGSEGNENSGFNDRGQVVYKCFAGGDAAIALWELKDTGDNLPPTSSGLTLTASQGQALQLTTTNLLSVITDPEGDSIALLSIAERSTKGGTIRRNGSQITYTPQVGFLGQDEFEYIVQDAAGLTTTAVVKITVTALNRAPIVESGQRGGLNITVEPNPVVTLTVAQLLSFVSDPDGDPITIAPLPPKTLHGATLTREDDLIHLRWDENTLEQAVSSGGDQLEFKAEDGRGGSVTVRTQILFSANQRLSGIQVSPTEVSFSLAPVAGTWRIERAQAVNGPWNEIGMVQIGQDRVRRATPSRRPPDPQSAIFRDTNSPAGAAFYRVINASSK